MLLLNINQIETQSFPLKKNAVFIKFGNCSLIGSPRDTHGTEVLPSSRHVPPGILAWIQSLTLLLHPSLSQPSPWDLLLHSFLLCLCATCRSPWWPIWCHCVKGQHSGFYLSSLFTTYWKINNQGQNMTVYMLLFCHSHSNWHLVTCFWVQCHRPISLTLPRLQAPHHVHVHNTSYLDTVQSITISMSLFKAWVRISPPGRCSRSSYPSTRRLSCIS